MPISSESRQWFAAYTTPRHEKRVVELLQERRFEAFLPLYRTVRQWKKSRAVALDLPLFPSYLFVCAPRSALTGVLGIPGVHSIVGTSRGAWPLPESEIEALRWGVQAGAVGPHPYLPLGQKARITSGPMAGAEGILVRRKNGFRFVLTLEVIMKSFAVEVDAKDLELVAPLPELLPAVAALSTQGSERSK